MLFSDKPALYHWALAGLRAARKALCLLELCPLAFRFGDNQNLGDGGWGGAAVVICESLKAFISSADSHSDPTLIKSV